MVFYVPALNVNSQACLVAKKVCMLLIEPLSACGMWVFCNASEALDMLSSHITGPLGLVKTKQKNAVEVCKVRTQTL